MAVYLGEDRETSAGPLDVSKNAGDDNVGLLNHDGDSSNSEPLDPTVTREDIEKEEGLDRKKNPLGYSITEPTVEEIEEHK